MVYLKSFLAGLALLLLSSAVPLTVPLGSTGQSLSISEDGQTVTLGSQSINIRAALNGPAACQSTAEANKGHGKAGHKGAGAGKGPGVAVTTNAKAIYFITNSANNSVVALKVAANGTLSDGSITVTGGAGITGVDAKGAAAVPDGLFSQGAIKVAGQQLVAANPGSNTITMFNIDPVDPTKLTMVGQPVDTLGEFPMSVAISMRLSQACVANSGAKAGIACFSMCSTKGLSPLDTSLRAFAINQTTPPSGPFNTVSQTLFNADSSALMTTVKGDPTVNNTGFLSIFPVINSTVSTTEIRSSPAGTAVLFGTALIPSSSSSLFVTDASFGAATLSLSPNNTATVSASTKIADQKATCWAAFSDVTGTVFVTDVAVNHLVEIDTATGQIVKDLESTNGNPGMIDLVSAGRFIYTLSPGNATTKTSVAVFDVSGGRGSAKEVQNFNPAGVTDTAQGMTFI